MPNVAPTEMAGTGNTRLMIEAVKETVADLKADVKEIKNHRFTDFLWHIGVFAAGFLLLATMMIAGYFKIEDRMNEVSKTTTRIDTKLEDLLQRIPPTVAPLPPPIKRN